MTIIEIPIRDSDEAVEVDTNDLTENGAAIIKILRDERAPLKLFLEFALEYYKRNMVDEFESFLKEGLEAANETPRDQEKFHLLLLNALAGNYIIRAKSVTGDKTSEKEALYGSATELFNAADQLNTREPFTLLGKGLLLLAKDQLDQAAYQFSVVLSQDQNNVAALLGQGAVLFRKNDIKRALTCFQKVLTIVPDMKPDVRVAIGVCFHKLGMLAEARRAFERALDKNRENVDALVLLAIMDWNIWKNPTTPAHEKREALASCNTHLNLVYGIKPTHPVFANLMADRSLMRQNLDKPACEKPRPSNYNFGMEKLASLYSRNIQTRPQALECFEKLKKLLKSYSDEDKKSTAQGKEDDYLNDPEMLVEMAFLMEETDGKGALQMYLKALTILEKEGETAPAELHNNIAVLYHHDGVFTKAEEHYQKALEICQSAEKTDSKNAEATRTTVTYNVGRLYEAKQDSKKAEEIYLQLREKHPAYAD
ncbi:protein required for normal CLN1 and CLN2 G1 cyclin expression, partial [Quaeritorhiza haematococci]